MRIIDLIPEYEATYLSCLKDWDETMVRLGDHKICWYQRMKSRGLRVKLAVDDAEKVAGMMQYVPIESSRASGRALYFVQCLWVHGYSKGMGNMHGRGIGKALLRAAEEDVIELGAKGIAAWGMEDQASWFRGQGFIDADSIGVSFLLWKAFSDDAEAPRWIKPRKTPEAIPDKVIVTMFINGWCTDTYEVVEFVRQAVAGCDDRVIFKEIDTSDARTLQEWGIENALFIDSDCIWSYTDYPPPTPEEIRNKIEQKLGDRRDE